MADERNRVMSASFSPIALEGLQNYALVSGKPESVFMRDMVEHHIGEAQSKGKIDTGLEQLAEICGYENMPARDFKKMLRQWRSQGMSNADILKELGQRDSDKNNEE